MIQGLTGTKTSHETSLRSGVKPFIGERNDDLYMRSVPYLKMTGRMGTRLYGNSECMVYIMEHPNVPREKLVLLGGTKVDFKLLLDCLNNFCLETPVTIGRLTNKAAHRLAQHIPANFCAKIIDEPVLDWKYPVYTLDTTKVSEMHGRSFEDFRNNVNRAKRQNLQLLPFNAFKDAMLIKGLGQAWASLHYDFGSKGYFNAVEPYEWFTKSLMSGEINQDGLVLHENDEALGVILWDAVSGETETSSLVSLISKHRRGANEYLQWQMCKALNSQGCRWVCIGGSETHALDAFKRKMNPENSLSLCSIKLYPSNSRWSPRDAANQ